MSFIAGIQTTERTIPSTGRWRDQLHHGRGTVVSNLVDQLIGSFAHKLALSATEETKKISRYIHV